MPNPIDQEDLYDAIVLDGKRSPGRVTLSGHNRKVVWNIWQGYSLNGATISLKQIPPIEFTASFYLVKDVAQGLDDYALWDVFRKVIDSTLVGRTPKAVSIYHPDLAANDVKNVVKAEIGGMVHDGRGGATVAVKFQEYRPARVQGGLPTKKPEFDPNADIKRQIDALTKQFQATPWG